MGHSTPLDGFYVCGDSTFPGIGVPAVAASGMIAAARILDVQTRANLDKLRIVLFGPHTPSPRPMRHARPVAPARSS